ncbi:MAG: helicase-related protein, partial [Planctomycetota bacterium]
SYYDYYQPEAYIPQRDIYIEKDASRNDDLDRLRLAATTGLVSRKDVIIVASVSCIFGLGSPEEYKRQVIRLDRGQIIDRQDLLHALNDLQYSRSDIEFKRATYRVRGDVVEIFPAYEELAYRVELFGDEIDVLQTIDPTSGEVLANDAKLFIFPAVHYVMPEEQLEGAIGTIKEELDEAVMALRHKGKLLEAQRLLARTKYDIEMMQEVGYCSGIENYSRHLDGRAAGSRPYTLLDYFPKDWLLMIDESHATIPQLRAMYNGDQNRKHVLVNTLTKRMAEDLAAFLAEKGVRCRYLHSEVVTMDRVSILRDLRAGEYDVLIGVNLLREGLDLPEVSLVAIMDADKTGFLRSKTSMIQQMGRAARNANATVILYADTVTEAMNEAINESERRRELQLAYNTKHGITPQTVQKAIRQSLEMEVKAANTAREAVHASEEEFEVSELIAMFEEQMLAAAEGLEFEKAAALRDRIKELKEAPEIGKVAAGAIEPEKPAPGTPGTRVMKKKRKTGGKR